MNRVRSPPGLSIARDRFVDFATLGARAASNGGFCAPSRAPCGLRVGRMTATVTYGMVGPIAASTSSGH